MMFFLPFKDNKFRRKKAGGDGAIQLADTQQTRKQEVCYFTSCLGRF